MGTLGSEIYEVNIDIDKKQVLVPRLLVNGHYSPCSKDNNEVWGLCLLKNQEQYISVSDDATVRIWDIKARK